MRRAVVVAPPMPGGKRRAASPDAGDMASTHTSTAEVLLLRPSVARLGSGAGWSLSLRSHIRVNSSMLPACVPVAAQGRTLARARNAAPRIQLRPAARPGARARDSGFRWFCP
jgi:hypothetical protein